MFSSIIRVCCDGGMGNTHIGSRRKDWFVERECKGYLRRGRDKSSVTTKIVALQPQGWEVVNNNYPRDYFSFNSGLDLFHAVRSPSRKEKKKEWFWQTAGKCWRELSKKATSISTLRYCGHMLHSYGHHQFCRPIHPMMINIWAKHVFRSWPITDIVHAHQPRCIWGPLPIDPFDATYGNHKNPTKWCDTLL